MDQPCRRSSASLTPQTGCELLNWVYATAAYGFVQAYHTYVQPLSSLERSSYYAEGVPAAALYGATSAPRSEVDLECCLRVPPND
jgi:uncharacterized protein (DUF2236 family)